MKKSVAIVGAGPSGLVAANKLLRRPGNPFQVTVFESSDRVGGMWKFDENDRGERCSPFMPTNISRVNVSFSDLSWCDVLQGASVGENEDEDEDDIQNVHLQPVLGDEFDETMMEGLTNASTETTTEHSTENAQSVPPMNTTPPMFPKAFEVHRYLHTYAEKNGLKAVIRFDTRVHHVRHLQRSDNEGQSHTWLVTYVDMATCKIYEAHFDYLIVASGFLEMPVPNLFERDTSMTSMGIQHSSKFDNLSELTEGKGDIVVVGGGFSGSEAAAKVALYISEARCMDRDLQPPWADSRIIHIYDRPFYCLPTYMPETAVDPASGIARMAPNFLPLDAALYNLDRRGEGVISSTSGPVSPDSARTSHQYIRSLIGGGEQDLGEDSVVYEPADSDLDYPVYTGVSDSYHEHVRSSLIVPVRGRASKVVRHGHKMTVEVSPSTWDSRVATAQTPSGGPSPPSLPSSAASSEDEVVFKGRDPQAHRCVLPADRLRENLNQPAPAHLIRNVIGIIEATGFSPFVDYLSDEVKEQLEYDPACRRMPFLFAKGSVFNPKVPELAFIGFNEGPYWGAMELQAELVAQVWDPSSDQNQFPTVMASIDEARQTRRLIKQRALNFPQFQMGDYLGHMEEMSRAAGITRKDEIFGGQAGPIFPSRYPGATSDQAASSRVRQEVYDMVLQARTETRFVAPASWRALQGRWIFRRKQRPLNAMPGSVLEGYADFMPRRPSSPHYDAEYVYSEVGTLHMDDKAVPERRPRRRKYVLRYHAASETITMWRCSIIWTNVFNRLCEVIFDRPRQEEPYKGWTWRCTNWQETGHEGSGEFRFNGAAITYMETQMTVPGIYIRDTEYYRPDEPAPPFGPQSVGAW